MNMWMFSCCDYRLRIQLQVLFGTIFYIYSFVTYVTYQPHEETQTFVKVALLCVYRNTRKARM